MLQVLCYHANCFTNIEIETGSNMENRVVEIWLLPLQPSWAQ